MNEEQQIRQTNQRLKDRAKKIERKMIWPGEFVDRYVLGPILGSGQFAIVRKVSEKETNEEYAAKIIDKTAMSEKRQRQEIEILKSVRHPNIIYLKEIFESSTHIILVMELVTGGELFDELIQRGSFSEKDAANILSQIVSGVQYLHERGIIHRDLKPENLLFATPDCQVIKIADFGLAKIVGDELISLTPCGTPICVAPEVITSRGYGKEVDLWTVGVILYILLGGYPPFQNGIEENNLALLFEQILKCDYQFDKEYWDGISESAKDLISKLLVGNPNKRFTADQTLHHPWMMGQTATTHDLGVLDQIKQYNAKRKFKGAVYHLIQNKKPKYENPSPLQIEEWKLIFLNVASSQNSLISIQQLHNLLTSIGLDDCDHRVKGLFLKYSEPSLPCLDVDHFIYFAQSLPAKPTLDRLRHAFNAIDKNHNGQISYDELTVFLKENRLEQEEVVKMIQMKAKGSKIRFPEFVDILRCSQDTSMSDLPMDNNNNNQ